LFLGGFESLVFPICALPENQKHQKNDLSRMLVRLYIGLEDPEVLIKDLSQGLE